MNSKEINEAIWPLDGKSPAVYQSPMGDKIIPYIGWYWREVDFEAESCRLGILPIYKNPMISSDRNDTVSVGFMQSNKWGYETFEVKGKNWKKLRGLIEKAVTSLEAKAFREVDLFMQSLLPEGKETLEHDTSDWPG